jgi:putative nonproteinogenic amino acid hydroxylase
MESRIIGKIDLDSESVENEVDRILTFSAEPSYASYSFGTWGIYQLWNWSGDVGDSTLREFEGSAQITNFGKQLPYLFSIIEKHFRTERMKWARALLLKDGNVIPHRDYLEFKKPLTRIHLALSTDEGSLHSEGEDVFQMRKGEVWYLAATNIHAAASLNDFPRVTICMEFDLDEEQTEDSVFRDPGPSLHSVYPRMIDREPLSDAEIESICGLGNLVDDKNFKDILRLLSKVHFYRRVHAGDVYDWLIEIARRSGKPALLQKTLAAKKTCIETRRINEDVAV